MNIVMLIQAFLAFIDAAAWPVVAGLVFVLANKRLNDILSLRTPISDDRYTELRDKITSLEGQLASIRALNELD